MFEKILVDYALQVKLSGDNQINYLAQPCHSGYLRATRIPLVSLNATYVSRKEWCFKSNIDVAQT